MEYVKSETISLKSHPEFNEKWLQTKIEEDPSIIGLGEVELRGSEKVQISGGRLDTILYDPEAKRRYEVEIQLGKTDESHIIRTIEYWDIERKKNPQYEHCAVIIAEDITSRFLNVISLFNGFIPLIAIQVKAVKIEDKITLFFTKVLDELRLELLEEDQSNEPVDRNYWVNKASATSMSFVEELFRFFSPYVDGYNLKYLKHYIGIEKNGIAKLFIYFSPRKSTVILHIKHEKTDEIDSLIDNSDLDSLTYDKQFGYYRIRLKKEDLIPNAEILGLLVEKAKTSYGVL